MANIIEQIQRDAVDEGVRVSTLLRKVKLAAAKLGLGTIEDWVETELNGYTGPVPEYRMVHGRPMSQNPVRGWEPIGGYIEQLSKRAVGESIAALEQLIDGAKEGGVFHVSFSDSIREKLNKSNGTHGWLAALEVDKSVFVAILDRVRTMVLDWALTMEKAGVHGSEFSFDPSEKKAAQAASTTINIGNIGSFAGNLGAGNIAGNVDVSGIDLSLARDLVYQLRERMDEFAKAGIDIETLSIRLSDIECSLSAEEPITRSTTLRGLLIDVKGVLVGAAGNLTATGAVSVINALLATGVPSP
jgi:AbiTii